MEKIGIFGGSFDPVHKEHVALCRAATESLGLDKLFIVPAKTPPHKTYKTLSSDADRLQMCRLAFADIPRCEVSDYELSCERTSYTYLTCRYFRERYANAQLFWLVGTDMLRDFPTWKNTESILSDVTLAVCARAEQANWLEHEQADFFRRFHKNFAVIDYNGADVSATKIRVLAGAGMDISAYTPPSVTAYIREKGLYSVPNANEALSALSVSRREHTLRVAQAAAERGASLHIPERKAITAALFHDCAKETDLRDSRLRGFSLQAECGDVPKSVLHQFTGAYLAEKTFGVVDRDVLDAVRYHTSGRANMSLLEKLIFLADMVEDGRDFDGVDRLRILFWQNNADLPAEERLDECLRATLTHTVNYLQAKGQEIYPLTLQAKEYYEKERR